MGAEHPERVGIFWVDPEHIQEGRYGGTDLSGLTFAIAADWPQAIHQGNGEAAVLIDEKADESQRSAVRQLVSGRMYPLTLTGLDSAMRELGR